MLSIRLIVTVGVLRLLTACSSPHDDAAEAQKSAFEAQEEVAKQRLELIDKYHTCIDDAEGDNGKINAC
jgi:hypothetical protein